MKFKNWLIENAKYGSYRYVHSCPASTFEDIRDMSDHEKEITRKTFLKYVDRNDLKELEEGLGYGPWLRMSQDWHVRYYKSVYRDISCVFFRHSRIEYIFTKDGVCGPSKKKDEKYLAR